MKRKFFVFGALLPLMCLTSCKDSKNPFGSYTDLSKEYILYTNVDYKNEETFLRYSDAYEVIDCIENGEDALILFTSETCHTCQEVLPSLLKDISHLRLNIFAINQATSQNASILNEYIAKNNIKKNTTNVMNGGTPSMYLLNKKSLREIFYGSKGDKTTDTVLAALREYASLCGIDYCVNSLENIEPSTYTYLLNKNDKDVKDFYYKVAFPLVRQRMKPMQVIDVTNATLSEKEEILEMFNHKGLSDNSGWSLDSFDGWVVSLKESGHDGKAYISRTRIHYSDKDAKNRLYELYM